MHGASAWRRFHHVPRRRGSRRRDCSAVTSHYQAVRTERDMGLSIVMTVPPVRWMVFVNGKIPPRNKGWWLGVALWLRKPPYGFHGINMLFFNEIPIGSVCMVDWCDHMNGLHIDGFHGKPLIWHTYIRIRHGIFLSLFLHNMVAILRVDSG